LGRSKSCSGLPAGRGVYPVTALSDNSHLGNPQPRARVLADYVYQGATIVAALLLVLSAAV
jgi:hypothetical protein